MKQTEFSSLREQAGVTIEALADLVGFSKRTVYRWERGEAVPRKAAITLLEEMLAQKRGNYSASSFTFIDLFAGIGGLRRGFESIGGKCVFTSEWNLHAQLTYKANYNCDHEILGDITRIQAAEIPPHDVLLAGFPCQPFSIAGVSKKNALGRAHGFRCESQGTLFFDVARVIEHHRPRAFLLENVKNLVNHDKGHTFQVIHDTLRKDLGYQLHWKVVDAKSFVPQHRERIFIVGFRDHNPFTFDDLLLPSTFDGPKLAQDFTLKMGQKNRKVIIQGAIRRWFQTNTRFQIIFGDIFAIMPKSTDKRATVSALVSLVRTTLHARFLHATTRMDLRFLLSVDAIRVV